MAVQALWVIQLVSAALLFGHAAAFADQMAACGENLQTEMAKCYSDTGIDITKITDIQSNPAKLQALNKELKSLCQTNKLSQIVDCVFDAMKTQCPKEMYDALTKFMNIKGIKEMTVYMCDNLDEMMDPGYKTCMESAKPSLKPCMENKAKEIAEMVQKEDDPQKQAMAQVCYGYDLSRYCMQPSLKTCPSNGKHILKIIEMIKPDSCKEYTLAAGMTKPSILLVVVAVINVFLAYMW